MRYLAQSINIDGNLIKGPLEDNVTLGGTINTVLGFLFPLAGVILFFILVWGGFDMVTSRGDAEKLKSAKAKITSGLVGFMLLILSFVIVRVLAFIFGLSTGFI